MPAKLQSFAITMAIALLTPAMQAQILLQDSFTLTAPNPDTSDVNFQVTSRQTGSLAPITYTKGDEPIFSQVGNAEVPNGLLLACRAAGTRGSVSLDHNFTDPAGIGNALTIQFDVNPVLTSRPEFNTTQTSWICIDFGSSAAGRNLFPQYTDGIGLLFRGNGQTQGFDDGTLRPSDNFALSSDDLYHHITIQIADLIDGNPFDGSLNPITINAFADANPLPFFTETRAANFTSNFISLVGEGEGSGGDGVVRHGLTNLQLSFDPISNAPAPEPATAFLLLVSFPLLARRSPAKSRAPFL